MRETYFSLFCLYTSFKTGSCQYESIPLCLTMQVSYPQCTFKWFNSDLPWFCLAEFQSACKEGALLHAYHWLDVVFPRDSLLQAQVGGRSQNSRTEVAQSPGLPWKLLGEWWLANQLNSLWSFPCTVLSVSFSVVWSPTDITAQIPVLWSTQ